MDLFCSHSQPDLECALVGQEQCVLSTCNGSRNIRSQTGVNGFLTFFLANFTPTFTSVMLILLPVPLAGKNLLEEKGQTPNAQ